MKVLLSAYSCHPLQGSESGIGWNWARSIAANGHEVVVMTRTVNRAGIEGYLRGHSLARVRFVYHDLPRIFRVLYALPVGNYAFYLLWQYAAAKVALKLHAAERFDRVQHITWGSFRVPSFIGKLGIPFIFGPVGGGEDTPKKLRRGLGFRGRLWDALRRFSSALMAPWIISTYESATEIVATTAETQDAIPARFHSKCTCRQAVGVDSALTALGQSAIGGKHRESPRLELLFVGRLLAWKGVHLLLKALASMGERRSNFHLTVIGAGSDRGRLERLSRRLGLGETVRWVAWMPRDALLGVYAEFDLFAFPSLHDSGGMAVLEAMSFGLPVLCLDLGGPATAVNETCGRVIPTRDRGEDEVVTAIAAVLEEIAADRGTLETLSEGARARAASLTWQANVDAVYGEKSEPQASSFPGSSSCGNLKELSYSS